MVFGRGDQTFLPVGDPADIFSPDNIVQGNNKAFGIFQNIKRGPLAIIGMDDLLLDYRQGPVFLNILAIIFVLHIRDLDDHHPALRGST